MDERPWSYASPCSLGLFLPGSSLFWRPMPAPLSFDGRPFESPFEVVGVRCSRLGLLRFNLPWRALLKSLSSDSLLSLLSSTRIGSWDKVSQLEFILVSNLGSLVRTTTHLARVTRVVEATRLLRPPICTFPFAAAVNRCDPPGYVFTLACRVGTINSILGRQYWLSRAGFTVTLHTSK